MAARHVPQWLRRWGVVGSAVIALVAAMAGTAAATTRPDARDGLALRAGALILAHDGVRYGGSMNVTVHNRSAQTVQPTLGLSVPAGLRFLGGNGVGGCVGVGPIGCVLDAELGAHEQRTISLTFGSSAAPARRARITAEGRVTIQAGAATAGDDYAGRLRGSTGSLLRPEPYQPSTDYDLALTASAPSVERDATGEFTVRIPLTAVDRTDAVNQLAFVEIGRPAGGGFPRIDPPAVCTSVCEIPGGWFASGESRSFAVLFTMPADTAPGSYPVSVRGFLTDGTGQVTVDVTSTDNTATVSLVI